MLYQQPKTKLTMLGQPNPTSNARERLSDTPHSNHHGATLLWPTLTVTQLPAADALCNGVLLKD